MSSVEEAQAWRENRQNVAQRKPVPKSISENPGLRVGMRGDDASSISDLGSIPGEDRDEARTRREIAEANLAELEEAERRRELISVSAVKAAISTDFAVTRDALMQLPARAAPLLAAETDPAACERMLHAEIHQALTTLAGTTDRLLP